MTQRNFHVQKGYILTYHSILNSASYNKQNYCSALSFSGGNCVHGTIMTDSCIYAYIWEQNEDTQKNFRKLPITSPSLTSVSTCGYYVIGDYELKFEILSLLLVAQVHLYKSISSVSGHQHFAGDTALILHNQSINHWPKVDWNSKRCSFHLQILLLTVP